ncbi:MAG: TonB-dependent receptor [Rhodospirillaceae bacterium]|nr:TonB-dependent receptor [Rhodospirillaceae bacterium]
MKRSDARIVILAAALSTSALSALAQDNAFIEEITVTAQKRAESVQSVPISIVALSAEQLERSAVTDILGIASRTPTLQYSQAGGEAQIYIRGVGSNLLAVGADPSVAIHLDGVYLGRPNMGLNQFLDVERVEVLRGPQGTLYGRNATGGSINILSKMPSQTADGYVAAGYGSENKIEVKGAYGGPINDQLSFRVAARHEEDDGYVKNLDPSGSDLDDVDLWAGRAALRYQGERVDATAIMDWSDFNNGNTAVRPLDTLGAASLVGAKNTPSLLEEYNNLPTFMNWKTGGPTLNVDFDVTDDVVLTSVSSYKTFKMDFYFNTDGTEVPVTRTTETFDTEQYSQELRLASTGNAPLQWMIGGYYLHEDKKGALGLVRENLRNAQTGAASPLGVFIIPAEGKTNAYAAFAQGSYNITEQLKVTAGLRYSDEKKTDANRQYNIFVGATATADQVSRGLFGGLNLANFTPATSRTGSASWDALTPKFGIDYQATENVLLYASATRGFKSGGYNDYQPTNPVFNPEFIWSYEAGVKSDLVDGKLRFNASAFYYDYSDLQVTTFLNSLTLVANAAQATVKGIDLEMVAQPKKAVTLGAAVSVLDAEYDQFSAPYGVCSPLVLSSPTCAGRTAGQVRLINAAGNRLNNAPKVKGNAFVEYAHDMGNMGTLTMFGQVSYTDRIFFNAANDANVSQDGYTLVDARLTWAPSDSNFEISLFGKNLWDKEYVHNIVQFTSTSLPPPATALPNAGVPVTDPFAVGSALGYPGPGRQLGIEAKYRF